MISFFFDKMGGKIRVTALHFGVNFFLREAIGCPYNFPGPFLKLQGPGLPARPVCFAFANKPQRNLRKFKTRIF